MPAMVVIRWLWNLALLAVGGWAAWILIPKIVAQGRAAHHPESSWHAIEGGAVMVLVVLCLAALSTYTWTPMSRISRQVFVVMGLFFAAGVLVSLYFDHRATGTFDWTGALAFIGTYLVFVGPILAIGLGWPGVFIRAVTGRGAAKS